MLLLLLFVRGYTITFTSVSAVVSAGRCNEYETRQLILSISGVSKRLICCTLIYMRSIDRIYMKLSLSDCDKTEKTFNRKGKAKSEDR
jgi:hypothetical protein